MSFPLLSVPTIKIFCCPLILQRNADSVSYPFHFSNGNGACSLSTFFQDFENGICIVLNCRPPLAKRLNELPYVVDERFFELLVLPRFTLIKWSKFGLGTK